MNNSVLKEIDVICAGSVDVPKKRAGSVSTSRKANKKRPTPPVVALDDDIPQPSLTPSPVVVDEDPSPPVLDRTHSAPHDPQLSQPSDVTPVAVDEESIPSALHEDAAVRVHTSSAWKPKTGKANHMKAGSKPESDGGKPLF